MRRLVSILLISVISYTSFGQSVQLRGTNGITVADTRWKALKNAILPSYNDTTQANLTTNIGIDSCGAMIFTYNTNTVWYRQCNPKKWVTFASGGTSSGDSTISVTNIYKSGDSVFTVNSNGDTTYIFTDTQGDTGRINALIHVKAIAKDTLRFYKSNGDSIDILYELDSTLLNNKVDSVTNNKGLTTDTLYYWNNNGTLHFITYFDHVQNGLLSGGIVSWAYGFTYDVSPAVYYINGIRYDYAGGQITLAPSDSLLPRVDVIGLDNTPNVFDITGTPSVNPLSPQVDPSTQLLLTYINVNALDTVPVGITNKMVYNENVAPEWIPPNVSGLTANPANTTLPFIGTYATSVGAWANNNYVEYPTATPISSVNYNDFKFYIRLKSALSSTANISVSFFNGNTQVAAPIIFTTATYGFFRTKIDGYQAVVLPLNKFSFTNNTINKVRFTFTATNANGVYLDYIQFQNGVQTSSDNYVTNVFRKDGTDSVFKVINGITSFAYKDSTGGGGSTQRFGIEDNLGLQDRSVNMQQHELGLYNSKIFYIEAANSDYSKYSGVASDSVTTTINAVNTITNNQTYVEAKDTSVSIQIKEGSDINTIRFPHLSTGVYTSPLSVNGNYADNTGNITISTGGAASDSTHYFNVSSAIDSSYFLLLRPNGTKDTIVFVGSGTSSGSSAGTVTSVGLTSSDITVGGTSPITSSGTFTLTLPTVNSNIGTFNNITINAKGQATAGSNVSYLTSVDTTNIPNFWSKVRSLFSATTPLSYSNGLFTIQQSNTSQSGFLSSTDWNTFNNKQPAGSYLTANQPITVTATGDATGTSSSSATAPSIALTLANTAVTPDSYTNANLTIDSKGRITSASNGSAGITSLNGLTDQTQTFSTGTSGADFNISSATGVHTFNLPDANGATARGVVSTGAQTFGGAKSFSSILNAGGGITTSATTSSANLAAPVASSLATYTNTEYMVGAANTQLRVGIRGGTSTVATAGLNVFALVVGNNTFTEATSGTSAISGGVAILTQTFTNGAGATTDFQNLYVGDAPTGASNTNTSINAGTIRSRPLIGTGNRQVFADANGLLTTSTSGQTVASWQSITSTTKTMVAGEGYVSTSTANAQLVYTLPASPTIGQVFAVTGGSGTGGWRISQNASQVIKVSASTTTTGTGGYIQSGTQYDAAELIYIATNTFLVRNYVGSLTIN